MGWSEKLPSGKYRGVYRDVGGAKRSAGTFTHKAKAIRAAGAMEEKARKRMSADPEGFKKPWREWREEWWPTRSVQPSTLRVDEGRRKKHLEPRWDGVAIGAIRRHDVKAWVAELLRGGLSPSMTQRCVHLLSASLAAAVDAEVIDANPAARIKVEGGEKSMERFLTHEEFDGILAQMSTTDERLVAEFLAYTGLRWGEMAGLHWNRVDLSRGVLRVIEVFDERTGHIKAYPKGGRARTVPLTASLVYQLSQRVHDRDDCGVAHRVGKCRSSLVLTGERGQILRNSNYANRVWKPALLDAGVDYARLHDLRHTYASWLLQAGNPLAVVGGLLGHMSTETTKRYAHLGEVPVASVLAALPAPRLPHEDAV